MSFIRDFCSIAVYILFCLISNTTDTQQLERYVPKLMSVVKMRRLAVLSHMPNMRQYEVWRSGGKRGMYVCMS
ncbi:hypothetical protein E4U28_004155 [Claviceps purpurea]|nr:hypothetical protein E4U28_004155 [Claviceps purpurea]